MLKNRDTSLIEFVYEYLKNHRFCSKNFLAGICVGKFYPYKPNNYRNIQTGIKRKISKFFMALKELGIVSQFNTTTIKVYFEKLKEFDLNEILTYTIKNYK